MRSINSGKEKGEVRDIDSEVLAYMLMGISNFVGLKYGMFETVSYTHLNAKNSKNYKQTRQWPA